MGGPTLADANSVLEEDVGSYLVLEEPEDENYEPTEEEIQQYAEWLGMDLEADKDLMWIAKECLKAPLPRPWKPCEAGDGEIFYFNFETCQSMWDPPCDEHYKKVYADEKAKRAKRSAVGTHEIEDLADEDNK